MKRPGQGLLLFGLHFIMEQTPQNYIYTSSGDLQKIEKMITRKDIGGVQIVYNWSALETSNFVLLLYIKICANLRNLWEN